MTAATRFADIEFESEHIARWAVGLNASRYFAGDWEYQPKTFDTPSGTLTPTFRVWWTTEDSSWIVVKPIGHIATPGEREAFRSVADNSSGGLYLVTGINDGHTVYLRRKEPSYTAEPFLDAEGIASAEFAQFNGWGQQ